jgi:hypothetical protein
VLPQGLARRRACEQKREYERLRPQREAAEKLEKRMQKRRRTAALASAHAKARTRGGADLPAASPLVELPEFILDAVVRTLDTDCPKAAARLACEHSVFLGAFSRHFRVFRSLDALQKSLAADLAAAQPQPAVLQSAHPPHLFLVFANLSQGWPEAMPVQPLTVMHACIDSVERLEFADPEDFDIESRRGVINRGVLLIQELEVDCGAQGATVATSPRRRACPDCGQGWCNCQAHDSEDDEYSDDEEQLEDEALDECYARAAVEARATLAWLRALGITVPVGKLTMRLSLSLKKKNKYYGRYFDDHWGEVRRVDVEPATSDEEA